MRCLHHGPGTAAIDWEAAINALHAGGLPCSAGERRMLHLAEAAEMLKRYLLDHPLSREFFTALAQPSARAALAEAGWLGREELDRLDGLGDPSDPGFADRVSERLQALSQDRAVIAAQFMRLQRTPSWEAERPRRS